MTSKQRKTIQIFAALFYFAGSMLFADYSITYEVSQSEVNQEGKVTQPGKIEKKTMEVFLSRSYFYTLDGQEKTVYNFSSQKISRINLSDRSIENYSLFSVVSFRTLEFENRTGLYNVLSENENRGFFKTEILEHNFSLKSALNTSSVSKKSDKGNSTFYYKNTPLMAVSIKGNDVQPGYITMFIKFLRYTLGGHQGVLSEIESAGKIPEDFIFYSYNEKGNRLDYHLKSIRQTEDTPVDTEKYQVKKSPAGTGDYYTFLNSIEKSPEAIKQKMASVEVDIQSALDRGNYLEALLGCMETGLYSSEFNLDICKNNVENMKKDKNAGIMFNYLNPAEQSSPEDSYREFASLEQFAGEKKYILWVFEADMLSRMGKKKESMNRFFSALEKNPYLTGVYKDMGEMFYANFNTDLAWMCWDNARSIYPGNTVLESIVEMEKKIKSKYPEYF